MFVEYSELVCALNVNLYLHFDTLVMIFFVKHRIIGTVYCLCVY